MPPKRGGRDGSGGDRRNFSISSFFDAAAAPRRGGGGFRIGAGGGGSSSSGQLQPSERGSDGVGGVYSATLEGVRSRILSEVAEEHGPSTGKGGGGRASSRLHQHRQRALQIAFGDAASSSSPQQPQGEGDAADDDDGIVVSSVEFSLLCPYSRLPMVHPVRSRDCRHVQCCDLESWMVLLGKCRSLRDPTGPCPVCERRVAASTLEIDFWLMHVRTQMAEGTRLVELDADGSYRNGDLTRERRNQQITTEVVDATQEGDYENYLGEVVEDFLGDDVDSGVTVQAGGPGAATAGAVKRTREPTPPPPPPKEDTHSRGGGFEDLPTSVKKEKFLQDQQQEEQRTVQEDEEQATRTSAAREEPPPLPSQDPGVVIVHYVEGSPHRALPSQVRLWVPHCLRCGAALLKGEDGQVETCRSCGQSSREEWTLVRRFEESAAVSLELTPDSTLILRGVDRASPYLLRAGFQRTSLGPAGGLWTTSSALSRIELDFLEACCQSIARGEDPESLGEAFGVPGIFRIPRRRGAGSAAGGYRSYGPTQQQQQLHNQHQRPWQPTPPSSLSQSHFFGSGNTHTPQSSARSGGGGGATPGGSSHPPRTMLPTTFP